MSRRGVLSPLSTTSQRFMLLTNGRALFALSSSPCQTSSRVKRTEASGGLTATAREREIMWSSLRGCTADGRYRSLHELRWEHGAPLVGGRLAGSPSLRPLRVVLVP